MKTNLQAMRKRQILIAEDDPLCAEDLSGRLRILDYEVVETTQCGRDAVQRAQELRPDLALIDIHLPGEMDGIEAAQQIQAQRVPVMFVTGYSEGPVFERAKRVEPYGYILKPYETRELKATIEVGMCRFESERDREKQVHQRQDLARQIERLNGLLSICGYCKKIKDDEGKWDALETYFMKRTAVSFSHGMCPDCFERVKRNLEVIEQDGLAPGSLLLG